MERKLNELTNLVKKLNERIIKASENNTISAIETDIMLDLLRQCYVVAEQLKTNESSPERVTLSHVAPVVQVIQESREEQKNSVDEDLTAPIKPAEEVISTQLKPAEEEVFPQTKSSEEVIFPHTEIVEEVLHPKQEPVGDVSIPQSDYVPQAMLPIEEIPVMSFPQVEVPQDVKAEPQPDTDESSSTNLYSAVGALAPNMPEPVEPPKSDYQSFAGSYSRETTSENQPPMQHSHQERQNGSFNNNQNISPVNKNTKQTGDLFGGQTIADKLKKETPSLIDKINEGRADQTLAHKMQLKPINDLKTAIGINEKFQFVNDLFEGRIDLYNDAITRLNNCGSALSADSLMEEYMIAHEWKTNAEAYVKLRTFIARRYL